MPPLDLIRLVTSYLALLIKLASNVVLPPRCAGCGRWDTPLCTSCHSLLSGPLIEATGADGAGQLPVYSLCLYSGPVRPLIIGWKNGGREDLASTMRQAGVMAGRLWATAAANAVLHQVDDAGGLLVVPAPSGVARRLRGRLVAAHLADAVATGIAQVWTTSRSPFPGTPKEPQTSRLSKDVLILSIDVLRRPLFSPHAHQAGRSSRARRNNRSQPPRVIAAVPPWPVLIVDDVVTTGATLGSCAQALSQAGAYCLGALTLAAAPSPRQDPGLPPHPHSETILSAHGDQKASK